MWTTRPYLSCGPCSLTWWLSFWAPSQSKGESPGAGGSTGSLEAVKTLSADASRFVRESPVGRLVMDNGSHSRGVPPHSR